MPWVRFIAAVRDVAARLLRGRGRPRGRHLGSERGDPDAAAAAEAYRRLISSKGGAGPGGAAGGEDEVRLGPWAHCVQPCLRAQSAACMSGPRRCEVPARSTRATASLAAPSRRCGRGAGLVWSHRRAFPCRSCSCPARPQPRHRSSRWKISRPCTRGAAAAAGPARRAPPHSPVAAATGSPVGRGRRRPGLGPRSWS